MTICGVVEWVKGHKTQCLGKNAKFLSYLNLHISLFIYYQRITILDDFKMSSAVPPTSRQRLLASFNSLVFLSYRRLDIFLNFSGRG